MNKLGGRYYHSDELKEMGFAHVGKNVKIHDRASIYCPENISIGDDVRIDDFAVIIATGKLTIGCNVHIANFCYIGAKYNVTLHDFCGIAAGVRLFTSSDDYSGNFLTGPTVLKAMSGDAGAPMMIGKHAIIGANSVLLPGAMLEEGCAVGALSLVKAKLDAWSIYAGTPAKFIKARHKKLLELEKEMRDQNV